MVKKSTKAKTQDHQEIKPPSIEEARNALSVSMLSWAWYLTPFHERRETERDHFYLQTILQQHELLLDFTQGQIEGFIDPILHLRTHWLNMLAVDVSNGIGGALASIHYAKGRSLSDAVSVVECIRELGLPSRHYEALSIFDQVNDAMQTGGITGEKHPGLEQCWRSMNSNGNATDTQVTNQYYKLIGFRRGVKPETIKNYIHNHKKEWKDRKHPG